MTANTAAKLYSNLTPEERFRLILAAGGRNDDAERDRLVRASQGSSRVPRLLRLQPGDQRDFDVHVHRGA